MSFLKSSKAFTLVELIVVITVIGVLTGGVALSITGNAERARDTRRKTDLQQIKSALEFFRSNTAEGYYPRTVSTGTGLIYRSGSNPGYTYPALVPVYMESMPHDPRTTSSNTVDYGYFPRNSSGGSCNNNAGNYCTTYFLTADVEDDSIDVGGTIHVSPVSVD